MLILKQSKSTCRDSIWLVSLILASVNPCTIAVKYKKRNHLISLELQNFHTYKFENEQSECKF